MTTITELTPEFMATAGERVLADVLEDRDTIFEFDDPRKARNFVSRVSALRVARVAPWHLVTLRVTGGVARCHVPDTAPIAYAETEPASLRFTAEWRNTLYERIMENQGSWLFVELEGGNAVARAHSHINNHKKRRRAQQGFSKWDGIAMKCEPNRIGFYCTTRDTLQPKRSEATLTTTDEEF